MLPYLDTLGGINPWSTMIKQVKVGLNNILFI